jgi:DNA-binding transcriptional ArsR family regulator
MSTNPNISKVASLIAEPSRAAILVGLLDGRTLLASELARIAGVTPQTASSHLSKLVEGGLLVMESRGRHRYYRLASPEVAYVLEAISTIAPPIKIRSLRESDQTKALCFARTCYDHLAGEIGVALTKAYIDSGWIVPEGRDYSVTSKGAAGFESFGINVHSLQKGRRIFARQCLDWSERRHHIAGTLGAAITSHLFALGWIQRIPSTRALVITEEGHAGLVQQFEISVKDLKTGGTR